MENNKDIVCESCGIRFQVICPARYVGNVCHCPFCGESELKEAGIMPTFEVKIWVSESRYYIVEAENEDEAYEKANISEPTFVKNHDREYEITARRG